LSFFTFQVRLYADPRVHDRAPDPNRPTGASWLSTASATAACQVVVDHRNLKITGRWTVYTYKRFSPDSPKPDSPKR